MNITNAQFAVMIKVNTLLHSKDLAGNLLTDDLRLIKEYQGLLEECQQKKAKNNARISAYIAEKRKTDKNYAR